MKFIAATFFVLAAGSISRAEVSPSDIVGAWESGSDVRSTKIITGQFFAVSIYKEKEFIGTSGGRWRIEANDLVEMYEFNTFTPLLVGTEVRSKLELKKGNLIIVTENEKQEWTRIDDGTPGQLSGAWLITGRVTNGQLNQMTPGARRTMKILSGTRFQWIAYNVETKEFSGTGGGTYTTRNGKYVENILFFSRDNSRVGATLQFDYSIEDGKWHHQGLSSKGDPIDEVWTKREKLGL